MLLLNPFSPWRKKDQSNKMAIYLVHHLKYDNPLRRFETQLAGAQ
jgi:hypothetical protein